MTQAARLLRKGTDDGNFSLQPIRAVHDSFRTTIPLSFA
jgi:hypothetical protein